MAAVAQATHLTHAFHLSLPAAGGNKFARNETINLTKTIPALDESPRGYYTQCPVQSWTRPPPEIKADKVCSRHACTDKASNPRGYNTGNVPPSYGPEDGNLYGDASHREAEDESTTVSKNMRRVPQNEAPAHGFSGGRAAQGTMSRSPEAAAQSGKAYDQETIEISTNKVM